MTFATLTLKEGRVMLDVAIVGGGVCGLALARGLARRGVSFALFEARDRLGGRVRTVENPTSGQRLDLGPTWFWPQTQPAIAALVEELGLDAFDQHDPGTALYLSARGAPPVMRASPGLHGGAKRLLGGMVSLVETLAAALPQDALHLSHRLGAAQDRGDHVELRFDVADATIAVAARSVALAVPPRLLVERVRFEPALALELSAAMAQTPTWMASSAKAVTGLEGAPIWRAFGQSGNAFVTHELAILGEVFDACDALGEKAALGGFFALTPDLRDRFRGSLAMLAANQFAELFGNPLAGGTIEIQDWACEAFTCASADRAAPDAHPEYGSSLLAAPHWNEKLHLGASETAGAGGGYLEGAINAARRIELRVCAREEVRIMTKSVGEGVNDIAMTQFREWVASQRGAAFIDYRKRLNLALSRGERDQLTQRAMLGAMESVFAQALAALKELPFDLSDAAVERGRSDLTPHVQAAFDGFIQSFLDAVLDFNRASCALSNFPYEHRPSKEYVSAALRDVAAAWREFLLAANGFFVAKDKAAA